MTRSFTKELFLPLENHEQKFRLRRRLFDTPSLIELNSPEFDQISDIEEQSEEEEPDESLFHAWERFKELLMKCPQHYLTDMQEVILFYNGLDVPTRQILFTIQSDREYDHARPRDVNVVTWFCSNVGIEMRQYPRSLATYDSWSAGLLWDRLALGKGLFQKIKLLSCVTCSEIDGHLDMVSQKNPALVVEIDLLGLRKLGSPCLMSVVLPGWSRSGLRRLSLFLLVRQILAPAALYGPTSTETSDGLAAIQAQLNNLIREIKKVNKKVYTAQVGCELCKGPHYTKDFPQKEEGKTLEEAYYTQFGAPYQPGGQYRAAGPGF
ncbi:hypothetical protein Tco_0278681 [Tanacetum coccineum]